MTTVALWLLLGCMQPTTTLTLPRAAAADEAVHLRVVAGVLQRGAKVVVHLANGAIVGTATPYGQLAGQPAGEYILPLPPEAIHDGKVELRIEVVEEGKARAARPGEVEKVDLVYMPVSG